MSALHDPGDFEYYLGNSEYTGGSSPSYGSRTSFMMNGLRLTNNGDSQNSSLQDGSADRAFSSDGSKFLYSDNDGNLRSIDYTFPQSDYNTGTQVWSSSDEMDVIVLRAPLYQIQINYSSPIEWY